MEKTVPKSEKHITAGPKALSVVSRWLGLKETDRGWRLDGLCALGETQVRLALRNGEHRFVFCLLPRSAPEAAVRTAKLGLTDEAGGGPAAARPGSFFVQGMGWLRRGGGQRRRRRASCA